MIPKEKSAAVRRGLNEAFGTRSIEDIRTMTRGLSSDLVFRIVVRGSPYPLRIMTRIDDRNDPPRVFACMKAAAEAGLAPRVLYSNEAEGIAIIDWIESVPFPTAQALIYLPATLRALHQLQPFPKTFNYVTAHKFFIWRLRTASLLPEAEIKEVFGGYKRICAVYPRLDADLVSCHMDLKPENILFDGRKDMLFYLYRRDRRGFRRILDAVNCAKARSGCSILAFSVTTRLADPRAPPKETPGKYPKRFSGIIYVIYHPIAGR